MGEQDCCLVMAAKDAADLILVTFSIFLSLRPRRSINLKSYSSAGGSINSAAGLGQNKMFSNSYVVCATEPD